MPSMSLLPSRSTVCFPTISLSLSKWEGSDGSNQRMSLGLQACIYSIPEDGLSMFLSQALGKLLKIQDCENNKESSEWA